MSRRGKATIPSRIAIVQRTLPHYRVPTFDALMRIAAPGSVLLHGDVKSMLQPKQTAFDGHVSFSRRALPAWFMHLRIRGKLFFPVFMPGLYRALAETNPDVILTEGESNLLNDLVVARYAKRAGVPYVWWGLGAIPGARPSGIRTALGGFIGSLIRGAAGVACYSSYARDFYLDLGARPENCCVVPNVLDDAAIAQDIARFREQAAQSRRAMGIGPDELVLLSVGSLERSKGIDIALEALGRIGQRLDRSIHYWIVGDGKARHELEELAHARGLFKVTFWGAKYSDVSLYFLMADVFVLPGLGGLALNQAMAHGLPVLCGPADGTEKDLLAGGACGLLLDEMNPETLADAICQIASLDIEAMGGAAARRIDEGYTLNHQIEAMAGILNRAAAKTSPHGAWLT